jgi:hypothetical protein
MRTKRAGQIALHEGEVRQLRDELVDIDSVLRLFDPETDPEGLPIGKRSRAECRTLARARSLAGYTKRCAKGPHQQTS